MAPHGHKWWEIRRDLHHHPPDAALRPGLGRRRLQVASRQGRIGPVRLRFTAECSARPPARESSYPARASRSILPIRRVRMGMRRSAGTATMSYGRLLLSCVLIAGVAIAASARPPGRLTTTCDQKISSSSRCSSSLHRRRARQPEHAAHRRSTSGPRQSGLASVPNMFGDLAGATSAALVRASMDKPPIWSRLACPSPAAARESARSPRTIRPFRRTACSSTTTTFTTPWS